MKNDIKTINTNIATIKTRGKRQVEHVQETGLLIIGRYAQSITDNDSGLFDARLATRLVEALGKGVQSSKLVGWFEKYAGLAWNQKKKCFNKAKECTVDYHGATQELWVDMDGVQDVMSPEEKLAKQVAQAIKVLTEQGYTITAPLEKAA